MNKGYYETGFEPDIAGALALEPPKPITDEDRAMFERIDSERHAILSAELAAQGAFSGPDRADDLLKLPPRMRPDWDELLRVVGRVKHHRLEEAKRDEDHYLSESFD